MNIQNEAIRYIGQITGCTPTFIPLLETKKADIPVYLVELYDLFRLKIFNRGLVLAVAKDHEGGFTPAEYAAHAEQLRDALEESIALVLSHVTAYQRNRLIKKGVAFIVPERQLFLPQILVDLRDYFPRRKRISRKTLSYPAQLVVLYHLLETPIEPYSLRELAKRLGYSAMTLSNVADELFGFDLCKARNSRRTRNLQFKLQGRKLWKKVLPHLRTPIQTYHWVRFIPPKISAIKAGITALSVYTQITDDYLPTYAIRNREYKKLLETGDIIGCHGSDEAKARIEAWFYTPELLADDNRVDRLSLYLTLRNSPDERVAKALREILGGVQW
jgi:DNA-binding MarR family transcriptional regulator